jgi:hypothetical protein
MPKWRLTEDHFIAPTGEALRHCQAGEVIEHPGPPSLFMEPVDAAARVILEDYEQQRGKRGRHPHGEPGWTGRR